MIIKLLKFALYLLVAYGLLILFLRWMLKALEDLDVQQ